MLAHNLIATLSADLHDVVLIAADGSEVYNPATGTANAGDVSAITKNLESHLYLLIL
jgi:hypothetical protein